VDSAKTRRHSHALGIWQALNVANVWSVGITTFRAKGNGEAIAFYKRALELDPDFAVAYASLGLIYANLGQASLAAENIKKAYALRDRVSEREKYRISALYYSYVTGELEQSSQVYELWAKSYPQDAVPHNNLGYIYSSLGTIREGFDRNSTKPVSLLLAKESTRFLVSSIAKHFSTADSCIPIILPEKPINSDRFSAGMTIAFAQEQ
jgi:tetratricopeptide (TPR) repeat protein